MSGRNLIVLAVLLLAAAGGGYYYYYVVRRSAPHGMHAASTEPPLPFYMAVKPFVVSMPGSGSDTHFVQIGVNLTLSGAAAGNLVTAMMPEVEDALRLSALSFKVSDITTPAGVDKLRAKMTADLNQMLLQRLGAERIMGADGGSKNIVRNIYFSQLIIE
ncbi:MAG TPA: flagellar basal body-associated FliL family protein [Stellaceae bacterium]|nr:flagellar basal body-associated FliL family protein [Stellaceae bacterium]